MTVTTDEDDPGLGLDEVLAALRHDLLAAQRSGSEENTGLGVREVQIELSVAVSRQVDAAGEAGAKWFVLSGSASGRASRESTSTNRITVTLGPLDVPVADGGSRPASAPAGSDISPGVIPRAVADSAREP